MVVGESDLLMFNIGAASTVTVSVAVTGSVRPVPVMVTVFVIVEAAAGGAKLFAVVSYTIVALPPAGTEMPVSVSGLVAPIVGVAWSAPFI